MQLNMGANSVDSALTSPPGTLPNGDYISQRAPWAREVRETVSSRTRIEVRWRARGKRLSGNCCPLFLWSRSFQKLGRSRSLMGKCRCLLPVVCGWVKPLVSPFSIRPAEGLAYRRALPVGLPSCLGGSLGDPSRPGLLVLSLGASPNAPGSMFLKPRILRGSPQLLLQD